MKGSASQSISVGDEIAQADIRSQLDRILASPFFSESPAASRFLRFVVQAVLADQAHIIKQYTIAVDACGYPADFDPHTCTAIRVLAGRLRAMLERYYARDGMHDRVIIEIPKRTYIPVFRLNPASNVVIAFDGNAASSSDESINYRLSVAVISFINNSSNTGNSSFANSLTMSLTLGLSQFRELRVIGPLRNNSDDIIEADKIGSLYNVRFMLEGSLQIYDDKLRIKTYFTDTCNCMKIWTHVYEYSPADMHSVEIEEDVTRRIVSTLADYTGIIPSIISQESIRKRHDCLDVPELICSHAQYLKAFTIRAYHALMESLIYSLNHVNPHDPIVLGLLSYGHCYNQVLDLGVENSSFEEIYNLSQRAKKCDPANQLAHLSEAILFFMQGREDDCIEKLLQTVSLNPHNSFVLYNAASMNCMIGRWETGMRLWKQATELNPYHPSPYFIIAFMDYYRRHDYESAWQYAKNIKTPIFWDPLLRAAAAGQLALKEESQAALQELVEMKPDFPDCARDVMSRYLYLGEHFEMLWDGLLKAGLKASHTALRANPAFFTYRKRL